MYNSTYMTCPNCLLILPTVGVSHVCTSTVGFSNIAVTSTLTLRRDPNLSPSQSPKNRPYYRQFERQRPPKKVRK